MGATKRQTNLARRIRAERFRLEKKVHILLLDGLHSKWLARRPHASQVRLTPDLASGEPPCSLCALQWPCQRSFKVPPSTRRGASPRILHRYFSFLHRASPPMHDETVVRALHRSTLGHELATTWRSWARASSSRLGDPVEKGLGVVAVDRATLFLSPRPPTAYICSSCARLQW